MANFHDVRLPPEVEEGASGGPGFNTSIVSAVSGNETRNVNWTAARGHWEVSYGIQDKADFNTVLAFFRARRGRGYGFRFKDWSDFQATDENIGTGNGVNADFQLKKTYEVSGPAPYVRNITRPVAGTPAIKVNGVATSNWVLEDFGALRFPTSTGLIFNDSFTKVLLKNLGGDTSTVFTDEAAGKTGNHTWTAAGQAQIDTGNPNFPSGALLCDGTGDYVSTPDHADFNLGAGTFDIEGEFQIDASDGGGGVQRILCGQLDSVPNLTSISFFIDRQASGNFLHCYFGNGSGAVHITSSTAFAGSTNPGKHHFRVCRDATNTLRLFIDGVQEGGNVAAAFTVNNSTAALSVGRGGELTSSTWLGWVGKINISIGTARYTTAYPPPGNGQAVTWTGEFDVPVRFDTDDFSLDMMTATAGTIPSLPIVEIREGAATEEEDVVVIGYTAVAVITATNAAWPVPVGTVEMLIEGFGGGGSGAAGNTTTPRRGSGGGAGGHFLKHYTGTMDSTLNITIGAGGAAVTSSSSGVAGNAGGNTTVVGANLGTLTANGGAGGGNGVAAGGLGGAATGGTINESGGEGDVSYSDATLSTQFVSGGGSAPNGGMGGRSNVGSNGAIPGGGGAAGNHTAATNSGAGARGEVRIWTRSG